tara:strand:- start:3019 stop:3609 length:591 start_codon:yes stop_codon:yes gene_type:complete
MSLIHLINASIISGGDEIYFYFKDKYFVGCINELGMICKTTCNGSIEFINRLPFENLTEWADSCIQEISKEYITRFSAWKRCTHKNSGLVLNNLRQMYSIFNVQKIPVTNATITTLQQTISLLLKYANDLEHQNKSMFKYIDGETDTFEETPVYLPKSLLTIAKLYDGYLRDKNITESQFHIAKSLGKKSYQMDHT